MARNAKRTLWGSLETDTPKLDICVSIQEIHLYMKLIYTRIHTPEGISTGAGAADIFIHMEMVYSMYDRTDPLQIVS
jgi:hypothetical protein